MYKMFCEFMVQPKRRLYGNFTRIS